MKEINIIVATSTEYGIGYDNKMCWNIPEELRNFQKITSNTIDKNKKNCVIMGKNTWLSLPEAHRPLKNRINIVLSKTNDIDNTCIVKKSFEEAIEYIENEEIIEKAFVIGGEQLYNTVLKEYSDYITKVYLSIIYDKAYLCNKFIDSDVLYKTFKFERDNIHFTEKYSFMIGYNKRLYTKEGFRDEPPE